MKLHNVELENWRQHTQTKIDFDESATVIYGPNETGKSTILEALGRGLFDKSSSSAEAIRRIKPYTASGNVSSIVRIELSLDGIRYRVEKNFNLRKGTSLHRISGDNPTLLSQDNDADEQLLQLLEADLPSSRGSKPSYWGALQWLWAPQENRELPSSKDGDPTASLHLGPKETTGVLVTPKFQIVLDRTKSCCSRYLTGTGQPKKDSPISDVGKQIQASQQRKVELNLKMVEVDEDKQQITQLQQQLPILENNVLETKRELERARTEVTDLSSIESELKACDGKVKELERDVQDAEKALKQLTGANKEVEDLRDKERKTREELSKLEALCEQLEKRQQEAMKEVEREAMRVRETEELTRDARILWTISDAFKNIEILERKIERINSIEVKIQRLKKDEVPLVPTNKEIEQLRKNQARIEALKESIIAVGLAVGVTPGEKGSLEVDVDGERLEGVKLSAIGTEQICIRARDLGEVMVTARMDKARDAKAETMSLEEGFKRTLSEYGVKTLEELQEIARKQNDILNNVNELSAEARGVDDRSIKELNSELKNIKRQHEKYVAIERTPNSIRLNTQDTDIGKLVNKREKEEAAARKALDDLRKGRDKAANEFAKKREDFANTRSEQKHFSGDLDAAITRERDAIRSYGSVENQDRILINVKGVLKKQIDEYQKIMQRYEDLEKGPVNKIKRLEKQVDNQEEVIRQQRRSIDHLEGSIDSISLEGIYSELARIESSLEILGERLEKERIHAESYQLLKEELEQQYRSALSEVVGPIREEVKRALGYITGFRHEDVELDEYLFPTRLGERGTEELLLEFTDASSGLKEVLALCVRLAVAKHLSSKDFQCLVLDDPLVHVSSDRSNRMIELINDAMEDHGLQAIVFTHRPMEFAGFNGKMVDIELCMS